MPIQTGELLRATAANQTLSGGWGADTMIWNPLTGPALYHGGDTGEAYDPNPYFDRSGGDRLVVESAVGVRMRMLSTEDGIARSAGQALTFTGIERLHLGDGNDTLNAATATPAAAHDGTPVHGLTVYAGGGNDLVVGSDADDFIDGGSGNDTIRAGGGWDFIQSSTGDDLIHGGGGNDNIRWGQGNPDEIIGNDTIHGGFGDDRLMGDAGNDVLWGAAGDDLIDGGAGNDVIYGGSGRDELTGGLGRDRFRIQFVQAIADDGTPDASLHAVDQLVADFVRGQDRLRVAELIQGGGGIPDTSTVLTFVALDSNNDRKLTGVEAHVQLADATHDGVTAPSLVIDLSAFGTGNGGTVTLFGLNRINPSDIDQAATSIP
jgi:Ca2+-binding RTX toxin-like protein